MLFGGSHQRCAFFNKPFMGSNKVLMHGLLMICVKLCLLHVQVYVSKSILNSLNLVLKFRIMVSQVQIHRKKG